MNLKTCDIHGAMLKSCLRNHKKFNFCVHITYYGRTKYIIKNISRIESCQLTCQLNPFYNSIIIFASDSIYSWKPVIIVWGIFKHNAIILPVRWNSTMCRIQYILYVITAIWQRNEHTINGMVTTIWLKKDHSFQWKCFYGF